MRSQRAPGRPPADHELNALETRIVELAETGGRLDIALALAELDPQTQARVARLEREREICRIEDLLRLAPPWMWERLLRAPTSPSTSRSTQNSRPNP